MSGAGDPAPDPDEIAGTIRVIGLNMQDVLFICASEGIKFPWSKGYRDALLDERPRVTWNYTAAEEKPSMFLASAIHTAGFTVLYSKRDWRPIGWDGPQWVATR